MRQRCRLCQGEAVLFGSPRIQKEKAARRRLLNSTLMNLVGIRRPSMLALTSDDRPMKPVPANEASGKETSKVI